MKSSRPSDTARLVARSIILASHDSRRTSLVPEAAAEISKKILTGGGQKDGLVSSLNFSMVRSCFLLLEGFLLPGIINHYLVRKLHIENVVRRKIAEGCRRVVVLGAGYDTLIWRLHESFPETEFIELDHPATQELKRRALGEAANVSFEPIDLTQNLPSTAMDAAQGDTVFVMEGLTMYLSPKRVAELLADLSALAGGGGAVVFTLMEKAADGSIHFRGESPLIGRWLKARSEPFLWGATRDELPDFLMSSHLALTNLMDHENLRSDYMQSHALDELSLAEGEIICEATPR